MSAETQDTERAGACEENADPVNRVLIISHEIVGDRMAGPGIRYSQLARILAREFDVTLAVPPGSDLVPCGAFAVLGYLSGSDPSLVAAVRQARAVLLPAITLAAIPSVSQIPVPLVVDGYDPFLAETLFVSSNTDAQREALTQAYLTGDFFVCGSERQRDWWLGVLEATGRVNSFTYAEDASLRHLIDLVPFGLPEYPPQHTHAVVKGVHPGFAPRDRVILWGGGLWPWLDPLTAIHAVDRIKDQRPEVRLLFPGTQHPNPTMRGMPTHYERARALARELDLLDRYVFFGDWVAYADWPSLLLECDVALSLHSDTLETRLAFRSRVLDYIWAGLPIVTTRGDATSDLVVRWNLGTVVEPEDAGAVAGAILACLKNRDSMAARFDEARPSLTWERAAQPLIEFCRHPRRAPDKVALGDSLGNPFYMNRIAWLQAESERQRERNAQLQNLVQAYRQRRTVRLADGIARLIKSSGP